MKIYFSHGKESGPWGTKIKLLAALAKEHGFNIDSIDYTDLSDPDHRVERLQATLEDEKDDYLLVGSSMGAYVSLVASEQADAQGLFLLAPALYMPGYKMQYHSRNDKSTIEIIHGWSDDIIPIENSIKFAQQTHCSLHCIDGDHGLNSSLDEVQALFLQFIRTFKNNESIS